jgi:hypothetical protein
MQCFELARYEQSVPAEDLWARDSTQQSRRYPILTVLSLIPAARYAAMTFLVHALVLSADEITHF